jgi:putative transposase
MSIFRFEKGALFTQDRRRYRISEVLPDGELEVQPLDGGRPMIVSRKELEAAYASHALEFMEKDWASASALALPRLATPTAFDLLPEPEKNEARRRHSYVVAIRKHLEGCTSGRWTMEFLRPALDAVREVVGDAKLPSISTLKRWGAAFVAADRSILGLVPNWDKRGNTERRMPARVVAVVRSMINDYYLTTERKTASEVKEFAEAAIDAINLAEPDSKPLPRPSLDLVYFEIGQLDPYEVCAARYGKEYADRKFKQVGRGPRPTRPLERVEIDDTKVDLMVVDDERWLLLGRPLITAALDKYSGAVTGLHIGFSPSSSLTAMRCLRHSILPKDSFLKDFPEVENDWPMEGVPEQVVCDNAKQYHSSSFEDALYQLGTEIAFCPVKAPWFKGSIERFLGNLNRELLQGQPGTTFSSIVDRKDYDPSKHAVISLRLLRLIVVKWICDYYHVKPRHGLRGIPLKLWMRGIEQHPPRLPRSADELVILLGKLYERPVHHYGVELEGLHFNGPMLKDIRIRERKNTVRVRLDEEDVGHVYVEDRKNATYVRVPCVDPEYATGLTLWQHRVIRRFALEQLKADTDLGSLAKAKAAIQTLVEKAWSDGKHGRTTRMRMARWTGLDRAPQIIVPKADSQAQEVEIDAPDVAAGGTEMTFDVPDAVLPPPPAAGQGWGIESTAHH